MAAAAPPAGPAALARDGAAAAPGDAQPLAPGARGPYVARWCFTIHVGPEASHPLDFLPAFDAATMEYMVIGREVCPDTGRNHLQGSLTLTHQLP